MALVILWDDFSDTERTETFVDCVLSQHQRPSNTCSDTLQWKGKPAGKYLQLLVNLICPSSTPVGGRSTREVLFVVVLIEIMYMIRLFSHHPSMISHTDTGPSMGLRL